MASAAETLGTKEDECSWSRVLVSRTAGQRALERVVSVVRLGMFQMRRVAQLIYSWFWKVPSPSGSGMTVLLAW